MIERAFEIVQDLEASAHEAVQPEHRTTKAVILAGGRGTRLAPFTSVLPKPLMPVGNRAILEIVVRQLEEAGITDLTFCVGYLSHLIRAVFDSGHANGNRNGNLNGNGNGNGHAKITYVHEEQALGTAAPLALVERLDDTFIVMNGDVLTTLDYGALIEHHNHAGNALTIATYRRAIKIDYGILHLDGDDRVRGFEEKPEISSFVSMGIYVMEPLILEHLPPGQPFDFPDLVQALLAADERVGAYPFDGVWFDIGRHDEYERAAAAWERVEEEHRGEKLTDVNAHLLHLEGQERLNANGAHGNGSWPAATNGNGSRPDH